MAEIALVPVTSSNLAEVGYDPASRTLRIRFHSGKAYDYPGVTPDEHRDFLKAKCLGKHFHEHFRKRAFKPVLEG